MSFFKKILGGKEKPINTYKDFWDWFISNEKAFYQVIKNGQDPEKNFFDKLTPKLEELKDGFYYLSGMLDDTTAELILTADGTITNMVFVEELAQAAPEIPNWKFTALKPALDVENVSIEMAGLTFNADNLSFYAIEHQNYPDEVDIVIAHADYSQENGSDITNGTYIFLDNFLGELNSATTIDNLKVIPKDEAEKELIPIAKLKDYLLWRESEFVEKYTGTRYNTQNDSYSIMEAEREDGKALIAVINTALLDWDAKASHPWILKVEIRYDGSNNNGMPGKEVYELLNAFEDEIMRELKDADGYLNVGRQTADSERLIFFACKDFRKPSLVLHALTKKYADTLDQGYDIYKDKYWQSLERFRPN